MTYTKPGLFLAAGLLAVAALASLSSARANGTTCVAYVGGLEAGKETVPELVLFNTANAPVSVTLVMRDPLGQTLATPADPLVVNTYNSAFVSLSSRLATAGPNGKAYVGRFSLEISGAAPFTQDNAIVHVTQYLGKPGKGLARPSKPKSAFIVRPLFISTP